MSLVAISIVLVSTTGPACMCYGVYHLPILEGEQDLDAYPKLLLIFFSGRTWMHECSACQETRCSDSEVFFGFSPARLVIKHSVIGLACRPGYDESFK